MVYSNDKYICIFGVNGYMVNLPKDGLFPSVYINELYNFTNKAFYSLNPYSHNSYNDNKYDVRTFFISEILSQLKEL